MFELPILPYSYDALEPYIDAKTMEIHYTKHHQTYINKLNDTLEKATALQGLSVQSLLSDLSQIPEEYVESVKNNGGGHYNHTMYWNSMSPNPKSLESPALISDITHTFGDLENLKEEINKAALQRFGSGWAWLSLFNGKLFVESTLNQDSPISLGHKPILGVDVWEHAYYLKYQNRRDEYLTAWWNVIDWSYVERLYLDSAIVIA